MPIVAQLEHLPAPDRRSAERRKLHLGSTLGSTGEDVAIHDISTSGMLIETSAELARFEALEIDLPFTGLTRALIVWNSGFYYGCVFSEPISKAAVSAALLRAAPAAESELFPAQRPRELETRKDAPPARPETRDTSYGSAYEEKWSLGASTRFILASAIMLWVLIIAAVIGITKLIGAVWR